MARRLVDVALAALALALAAPILALAAAGIWLSSPGPVVYRAPRVGVRGRLFTMYKLRTMHVHQGAYRSSITAHRDPRVFRWGALLRWAKLDELPQLFNVLRGDMALVGPRPEIPDIVQHHYGALEWETLAVRPGMTSPGSIYNYTHGEALLAPDDPERHYVERLLPIKLALDVAYVRRASWRYDAVLIGRTVRVLTAMLVGRRNFADPPEMSTATALLRDRWSPPQPLAPKPAQPQAPVMPASGRAHGPVAQ